MWTSTREDMTSENWIPNHFVPLLQPIEIPDFLDSSADDVVDQGCGPVFNNTMLNLMMMIMRICLKFQDFQQF